MKIEEKQFRFDSNSDAETSQNTKKDNGFSRIVKPEDNLFLSALSWLHILAICAGLYLLTTLAYDMEMSGELLPYELKSPAELLAESLWLIVPLALGWILIRATRSLVVYLLCSCVVCALLAGLTHSVLTVSLSAFLLAARCYTRLKKGKLKRMLAEMPGEAGGQLAPELWEIPTFLDRPVPTHWGVFAFYYLIFLVAGKSDLLIYVFYLLLADVFVCFLFGYQDNMQRFIRENKRIANLPVHSIQKVGRILLLVSVILLGLIVLPSALYGREPLTNLRAHIKPVELTPSTDMEELMQGGLSDPDFGLPEEAPTDPPAWLVALGNVLFYLGAVAVGIALLIVIYRVCRNALSYFAQDEADEILFLGTEESSGTRTKERRVREKKERRSSPNRRIRRQYKKTILRAMGKRSDTERSSSSESQTSAGQERTSGRIAADRTTLTGKKIPAGWETPTELETKAQLIRDPSTDKLHTLYEKARYSREGCTKEEAESLKG